MLPLRRLGRNRRLGDTIQQFLVAAHEPELLTRKAFLKRGIRLDTLLVPLERIHDSLQRVDGTHERLPTLVLAEKIARAEFPALHRKDKRGHDRGGHQHLLDAPRAAPAS